MTTKIPVELSSTPGIVDGSNATAITIDSSENVNFVGDITLTKTSTDDAGIKFATANANRYIASDENGVVSIGTGTTLTGGTQYLTIDSGKVGIGTTSPDELLELVSADPRIRLRDSTAGGASGGGGKIEFGGYHAGSSDGTRLWAEIHGLKNNGTGGDTHGDMIFKVNTGSSSTSEVARFNFDGDFLFGTTNAAQDAGPGVKLKLESNQARCFLVGDSTSGEGFSMRAGGAYKFFVGYNGTVNATNTSIASISDERLKENITDLETGLSEVMSLKPRRFDWKEGEGSDTKNVAGFVAQ